MLIATDFKFDVVELVWSDAFHGTEPLDVAEIVSMEKLMVRSLGYLIHEDDQYFYLGFSLYDTWSTVKHWQAIPKSMVFRKTTLKDKTIESEPYMNLK